MIRGLSTKSVFSNPESFMYNLILANFPLIEVHVELISDPLCQAACQESNDLVEVE